MSLPQSRRLDFDEVPVIDLSRFRAGEPADDDIAALYRACRDVGFLYVSGHGIASELIEQLRVEARRYFALPVEAKARYSLDQRMRGYLPLDYASYEGEARQAKSRQEGFWIGHDRPLNQDNLLDGPNYWPEESPGLRDTMETYLEASEGLARVLQRAFARALGLDEAFFLKLFEQPQSLLKLNHYPPQENPTTLSHIGVVPHADSGGFTILWQDENGGLEVQTKSGDWVGAPPIPDTFVINIGNILQIWTDGEFSSTPHRVINRGNADRYSIPLFVNPGIHAPIGPLIGPRAGQETGDYRSYQRNEWRRAFPIAKIAS